MNPLIQLKTASRPLFIALALICPAAAGPKAQAVVPPPDGGYPNFTTAEGTKALRSLTTGAANTAVGWYSLFSNTDGSYNTGVGAGTLLFNVGDQTTGEGTQNTAIGAAALLFNTTGFSNTATGVTALLNNTTGVGNTATGANALFHNTTGGGNTATGLRALELNDDGIRNTANGVFALNQNISGGGNTAVGYQALVNNTANSNTAVGNDALVSNTSGSDNTAIGAGALAGNMISHGNTAIGSGALASGVGFSGTDGNTAIGYQALFSSTVGFFNVAIGYHALFNQTIAADNIALGANAGSNVVTADNVICIGTAVSGANVGNTCFIGNIFGVTTGGAGSPVLVDSSGQLGTMSSSRRFKNEIKPMDSASESILALKPVTFHYKSDPAGAGPQFGLIAEEVAEVNPDLVVRDKNGEIYTVRYDAVNAMLLNEFLKEHRKVQKLQATVVDQQKSFQSKLAEQEKRIEALASGLQKVSARLSASSRSRGEPHVGEPAQQVVARTPRENSDLASATSFCNPH